MTTQATYYIIRALVALVAIPALLGMARGFTLPRIAMAGPLSSLAEVLRPQAIDDNLFFTPFRCLPKSIDAATAGYVAGLYA